MTKLQAKLFLNIVFLIFYLSGTNADTIVEFRYSGFDFRIDTRSEGFFTGNITVKEKGNTVFSMDSTFTSYVDHKFIDLRRRCARGRPRPPDRSPGGAACGARRRIRCRAASRAGAAAARCRRPPCPRAR